MHLLQAGVNLIYIRDLLGHADVSTTEIYANSQELHQTGEETQVA
jgi:integrase/recombinase XerD